MQRAQHNYLRLLHEQHGALAGQLNLVSPLATLERGFSISRDAQQNIIRRTSQVNNNDTISVQVPDGHLDCVVTEVVSE
jgi:exodeoxyribonuclease VII large subunit